ncbi:hypothetical protein ACFLQU_03950 [Verrucomicrobiota bacterium]
MKQARVMTAALVLTGIVSGCASMGPGGGEAQIYRLELDQALNGKGTLVVHAQHSGIGIVAAFGESPKFNQAAHDVDTSGLSISGGRIAGKIKVTVNPDLWVPKSGKSVMCVYTIDAETEKGKVTGTYEGTYSMAEAKGTVSGKAMNASAPGAVRFRLQVDNAISGGGKKDAWLRRALISFKMDDGKVAAVGVKCPESATKMWMAKVTKAKLAFDGARLTGVLVANIQGDGFKSGQYMFELDGKVIGDRAGGRCTVSFDGKKTGDRTFIGSVEPVVVPAE